MVPEVKVTDQGRAVMFTVDKVFRHFTVRVAHPGHKWGRHEVWIEGQPRRGLKTHDLEMSRENARKLAEIILAMLDGQL